MASWAEFARGAPELAASVKSRFEANLHHVLGTIRPDGAPRLSGSEIHVEGDDLTLGMMAGSRKLADVLRDPRVEIHCAPLVSGDESDLCDVKVAGKLVTTGPTDGPDGTAFRVDITGVSRVRVMDNQLVVDTWRPGRGTVQVRRS
jgi:hypothetical protein